MKQILRGKQRLTANDVLAIRRAYRSEPNMTYGRLAQIHLVSAETIRRAITGETWGWLTEDMELIPDSPRSNPLTQEPDLELEAQAVRSLARVREMLGEGQTGSTRADKMLEEMDEPTRAAKVLTGELEAPKIDLVELQKRLSQTSPDGVKS